MLGDPPLPQAPPQDTVSGPGCNSLLVVRPRRQHVVPDKGQHPGRGQLVQLDVLHPLAQPAQQGLGVHPAAAVGDVEHADQADGEAVHREPVRVTASRSG